MTDPAFESLDFIYWPSADVPRDVAYFEMVLRANVVFAIEGMGTRVAMLELTTGPPRLLLAGHLDGDAPVLVYRVPDLDAAIAALEPRAAGSAARPSRFRTGRSVRSGRPAASDSRSTSSSGRSWTSSSQVAATSERVVGSPRTAKGAAWAASR